MKNMQKGFTLVELIVVITILAILGTIAFISLQGYSQDARDSKVVSDIRSLASALETEVTQASASIHSFTNLDTDNNITGVTASGTTALYAGTGEFAGEIALDGARIETGDINFIALGQNSTDFGESTYKIATLTHSATPAGETQARSYSMYQLVGAKGIADAQVSVVKGNFLAGTDSTDGIVGLLAGSGGTAAATGLADNVSLPNGL